jgi:hypothetical protein
MSTSTALSSRNSSSGSRSRPAGFHSVATPAARSAWRASHSPCGGDQAAIAAQLEELADAHGIGLTQHRITVDRALAVVQAVNSVIDEMQHNGALG